MGAKKVESSEDAAEISEEEDAGEWMGERWWSGVRSCLGGGVVKPGAEGEAGREEKLANSVDGGEGSGVRARGEGEREGRGEKGKVLERSRAGTSANCIEKRREMESVEKPETVRARFMGVTADGRPRRGRVEAIENTEEKSAHPKHPRVKSSGPPSPARRHSTSGVCVLRPAINLCAPTPFL